MIKVKVSQDRQDSNVELSSEEEESYGTEEEKQDSSSGTGYEDFDAPTTSTRQRTDSAVQLVTSAKLSTKKAHTVCKTLAKSGISLPTPSQSGVYKATMKAGERLKQHYKETLRNETWSLHFDGKHIKKREYEVVVLKNENREVKLTVLEYDLWPAIKIIISDTTSANTGKFLGAVTRLQNQFVQLGLQKPLYIGCQHHVLDTVLKHVMDYYLMELPSHQTSIIGSLIK